MWRYCISAVIVNSCCHPLNRARHVLDTVAHKWFTKYQTQCKWPSGRFAFILNKWAYQRRQSIGVCNNFGKNGWVFQYVGPLAWDANIRSGSMPLDNNTSSFRQKESVVWNSSQTRWVFTCVERQTVVTKWSQAADRNMSTMHDCAIFVKFQLEVIGLKCQLGVTGSKICTMNGYHSLTEGLATFCRWSTPRSLANTALQQGEGEWVVNFSDVFCSHSGTEQFFYSKWSYCHTLKAAIALRFTLGAYPSGV